MDRVGIATALTGVSFGIEASFFAATQAGNIGVLAAIHFILGMFAAVGFAPLMSDISHWFIKWRGTAMALVASTNYLSGAVWPTALAGVLAQSGWRATYQTLAVITIVVVLPLAVLLRRRALDSTDGVSVGATPNRGNIRMSPARLQLYLGFAGVACCVAMSMPQVHIVTYCVGLGYGPVAGAEMLSLMLFGGVLSRIFFGLLSDRLGGVRTLLVGSALQCLGLGLYLPYDGLVSLYLVSLIFGLSQGGLFQVMR